MTYKVIWHPDVYEDLDKIGKKESERIITKVENYLIKGPYSLGKPLKGSFKGLYRYRIGKYRVIYLINEEDFLILVVRVGKRDEIYQKRDS